MGDPLTEADHSERRSKSTAIWGRDCWSRFTKRPCASKWSCAASPFQRQLAVDVVYKERVIKGQKLDLLVGGEVVVELKSLAKVPEVATAQTLSYLKATGLKRALLINFGAPG